MAEPQYTYSARVLKVIDGDTIGVLVDVGFFVALSLTLRLYGVNAPELREPAGKKARAWVSKVLPIDATVVVKTFKAPGDKYGRWLAKVFLPDGTCLNDRMIEEGHAVPYDP